MVIKYFIVTISLVVNILSAQNYVESDFLRPAPRKGVDRIEVTTEKDTINPGPFVSYITYFNKEGYVCKEKQFDYNGKKTYHVSIKFLNKTTEVETHHDLPAKEKDILLTQYNSFGYLEKERWIWDEDNDTSTELFEYDQQNRLIKKISDYTTSTSTDTIVYKDNRIHFVISRFSYGYGKDSTIYLYNPMGHIQTVETYEIRSYEKNKKLRSTDQYITDSLGHILTETSTYYYYTLDKSTYITSNQYYPNGIRKESSTVSYSGDNIEWSSKITFDEVGEILTSQFINEKNKGEVFESYKTYYRK